ncbi:MAG: hypothetical protein AAFQ02_04655 [Bacteroidota bacterium]
MDALEKYIISRRSDWDDQRAPDHIWHNIEKELDTPEQSGFGRFKMLLIAAGILATGYAVYHFAKPHTEGTTPMEYAEIESFEEVESYYQSAIYATQEAINQTHDDQLIKEDLRELDEIDIQLREEYLNARGEYREFILQALIENQQTKLSLLQHILEQVTDQKDNTNDTIYY